MRSKPLQFIPVVLMVALTMISIDQGRAHETSQPSPPMIVAMKDKHGVPIPWASLSGLCGDPQIAHILYAVSDSFFEEGYIYKIDVSQKPATIIARLKVTGAAGADRKLDLEGISIGPAGNFWLASEGNGKKRPNLILKVDKATGMIISEFGLPHELATKASKKGFEGVAVVGDSGKEIVYAAFQRAWPKAGETDKLYTKIGRLDTAAGEWRFAHYPLENKTDIGRTGVSELTLLPDGTFAVLERDRGQAATTGDKATLKAVFRVDLANAIFRSYDDPRGLIPLDKILLIDIQPALEKANPRTTGKLEGFAVAADGRMYAVTDNDGSQEATAETLFLDLGKWQHSLIDF